MLCVCVKEGVVCVCDGECMYKGICLCVVCVRVYVRVRSMCLFG